MAKAKKRLIEMVEDEMQNIALEVCEKYCKYGEQVEKDQEKYDGDNPTFKKRCLKCPMVQFF